MMHEDTNKCKNQGRRDNGDKKTTTATNVKQGYSIVSHVE